MKIATLGCDQQILKIVQWMKQTGERQLALSVSPGVFQSELQTLFPNANFVIEWQSLIDTPEVDVIFCASRDESESNVRTEALKKIVEGSTPLIFMHPVCESIDAIECEMIRSDTNTILLPFLPERDHPGFQRFREILQSLPDPVEQIVFERFANDRQNSVVMNAFATDAILLRELMGDLQQVGAMGGTKEQPDYSNLAVNMTSKSKQVARWSISPVDEFQGARITAVDNSGRHVLTIPDDSTEFSLQSPIEDTNFSYSSDEAIAELFRRLKQDMESEPNATDWKTTCHALEVADCAVQSCRRNRTIELLGEQPTEEDTFKAMMTAGGCGMMFWVLLLLPFDALIPRDNTALRFGWYVLFLMPLVIFLGLQFLKLLFKKKK